MHPDIKIRKLPIILFIAISGACLLKIWIDKKKALKNNIDNNKSSNYNTNDNFPYPFKT